MESYTLFLQNLYWIDVMIILIVVLWYYLLVWKNGNKIGQKNSQYNTELLAMRTEIYTQYEKNFFL
jgi:hypothetical protein